MANRLQQTISLQTKISPQQIQMIKLLELPTMQLEERIKREIEENIVLEEDAETLRRENELLRSLIASNAFITSEEEALPEINPVSPTEFLAAVADAQNEAPTEAEKVEEKTEEKPKPKVRSRVGSMFDLLSFNEP